MAIGDERARAPEHGLAPEARDRLAGLLLLGAGGILLVVSSFLDWFEPGITAWTAFEVWDMVLVAFGLIAVVAAAGALNPWRPVPDRWVLLAAVLAPVIVIVSLVNHPPLVQGLDEGPMVGIWLALAGSLLMLLGALLAIARISVAVELAQREAVGTPGGGAAAGGRFVRGRRGAPEPPVASPPATPPPATPPPATPPPEAPIPGDGATTPTRRLIP